jgi:hypothetical protein
MKPGLKVQGRSARRWTRAPTDKSRKIVATGAKIIHAPLRGFPRNSRRRYKEFTNGYNAHTA